MTTEATDLSGFGGVARLFPLPDFVLFPHVVAPLHIFEPRYRQMTADALAGDRLIALALLRPGWEEDYQGAPGVHPVACLAHIINEQKLADGKYNLLVRGLARLRIEKELPTDKLYRLARCRPLPDGPHEPFRELRQDLEAAAVPLLPAQEAVLDQMKALFQSPLPLGSLCDVLSFALPITTQAKQALLEERDVEARARRLLDELQHGALPPTLHLPRERLRFPPDFSAN